MPAAGRELSTILVAPAVSRQPRFGIPEVYAAIAALSFLVARFVPVLELHLPCAFLVLTGHPCATCGMTRAFVSLAHGHLVQAFQWNPMGALVAAGAWGLAVADLVRVAAGWPLPRLPEAVQRRWVLIGAGALLVNWAYLLVQGLGPG